MAKFFLHTYIPTTEKSTWSTCTHKYLTSNNIIIQVGRGMQTFDILTYSLFYGSTSFHDHIHCVSNSENIKSLTPNFCFSFTYFTNSKILKSARNASKFYDVNTCIIFLAINQNPQCFQRCSLDLLLVHFFNVFLIMLYKVFPFDFE